MISRPAKHIKMAFTLTYKVKEGIVKEINFNTELGCSNPSYLFDSFLTRFPSPSHESG